MATAYERKQREDGMITPKRISDAKENALRLHALAFAARPVWQADGTTLDLCWMARCERAYSLRSEAKQAGNEIRQKALDRAIVLLQAGAQQASADAQRAIDDYVALCAGIGQVADTDVFAVNCTCVGCIEGQRKRAMWEAERAMRTQFAALFVPALSDASNTPAVVALLVACDSAPLQALGRAMQEFIDKSRVAGVTVDWADSLSLSW